MSLFGVIMLFITIAWTAILMFVMISLGDIMKFFNGPAVLTFIVGYIIIVLVFLVTKRIVLSM
jgi:hypothetical protein